MAMADTDRPENGDTPEEFEGEDRPFELDDSQEADVEDDSSVELELGDDDERLPWLEAEDDDDDAGAGGQIFLLGFLAFAALALIVGGIWWFTRDKSGETAVADGSLIEAPDEPYKEKPDDPGGMTFEGTGDSSYAVSEGESRPAQLGTSSETPMPGFDTVNPSDAAADAATGTASAPASAPASSGPAVQVGAYSTRKSAQQAWDRLSSQYSALKGQKHRIVEGKADIGTVFRLQALTGDKAEARKLCTTLKTSGLDCSIKN